MYYLHSSKKTYGVVFCLLILSNFIPTYSAEGLLPFNWQFNNKKMLMVGTGGVALVALFYWVRSRRESPKNTTNSKQKVNPFKGSNSVYEDVKEKFNPTSIVSHSGEVRSVLSNKPDTDNSSELVNPKAPETLTINNKQQMSEILTETYDRIENKFLNAGTESKKDNDKQTSSFAFEGKKVDLVTQPLPFTFPKFKSPDSLKFKFDSCTFTQTQNSNKGFTFENPNNLNGFTTLDEIRKKQEMTDNQLIGITNSLVNKTNDYLPDDWSSKKQFLDMNCFIQAGLATNNAIKIGKQAVGAYVFCDRTVIQLINNFIDFKKNYGTAIEKDLYNTKKFTPFTFIQRLFTCRPMVFLNWGHVDDAILDKENLYNGYLMEPHLPNNDAQFFEKLPNDQENLEKYQTYDEMRISALLMVYGNAFPINKGNRINGGNPGEQGSYEEAEIGVAGLIGARFEKPSKNEKGIGMPGFMEYQDIIIDPDQNTVKNGYGDVNTSHLNQLWADFWELKTLPTYQMAKDEHERNQDTSLYEPLYPHRWNGGTEYVQVNGDPLYLHKYIYKERMKKIYKPYLKNIIAKHKVTDNQVYITTVGLGSGEWGKIKKNNYYYLPQNFVMATFLEMQQIEVIKELLNQLATENPGSLQNITDIDIAFLGYNRDNPQFTVDQYDLFEKHNQDLIKQPRSEDELYRKYLFEIDKKQIFIHFSQRCPFEKLKEDDEGKTIEAVFPWDSNAPAGNEFWAKKLGQSGDPAMMAALNGAAQMLNPHINTYVKENVVVY